MEGYCGRDPVLGNTDLSVCLSVLGAEGLEMGPCCHCRIGRPVPATLLVMTVTL